MASRECLSIHFLTPKLETISVHTCSIKWSLLYLSRRAKGLHIELTAKSWHRRRPQFFSCPHRSACVCVLPSCADYRKRPRCN